MDLEVETQIQLKILELQKAKTQDQYPDKQSKSVRLQEIAAEAFKLISDPATAATPEHRAKLLFYKGKTLDFLPGTSTEAVECLSKAIKNDPSLSEAWSCLGHCYWKQENLAEALTCYRTASEQDPENPVPLRELARVLRLTGKDIEERRSNVEEALTLAKKAISMNVKDGATWYVLGNCQLSSFIQVTSNPEELQRALKCFTQAEKAGEDKNPDLHFNRAIVYRYNTDLSLAHEGFVKAFELDPSLGEAKHEMLTLRLTLDLTMEKLANCGGYPSRRLDKLVNGLHDVGTQVQILDKTWSLAPLSAFEEPKPNTAISVRVLSMISRSTDTPLIYVVCDKERKTCALTVYNVSTHAVKEGDEIWIPDPIIMHRKFTLKGLTNFTPETTAAEDGKVTTSELLCKDSDYDYHNIVVPSPQFIVVNKKKIPNERYLAPRLTVTAFA